MITLVEFLRMLREEGKSVESIAGFSWWIEKVGCPKEWPEEKWRARLEEFLSKETK